MERSPSSASIYKISDEKRNSIHDIASLKEIKRKQFLYGDVGWDKRHAKVSEWLEDSFAMSAAIATPSSEESSTLESPTIYGSNGSLEDDFEGKCISKLAETKALATDEIRREFIAGLSQSENYFRKILEDGRRKFPTFDIQNISIDPIVEGVHYVKSLFGIEDPMRLRVGNQLIKKTEFRFLGSYRKALALNLSSRLLLLHSEFSLIEQREVELENNFEELLKNVRFVCFEREYDKLVMHTKEIKNLVYLLVGLACRLANVEQKIAGREWKQEEEGRSLEKKRDQLEKQMIEGITLKECIAKKSRILSELVQHHLGERERKKFEKFIGKRIKNFIEMKEVEEMIRICELLEASFKNDMGIANN